MPTIKKVLLTKNQSSLKAWIESKPYWEQLLWFLHLENGAVSEEELEGIISHFLVHVGAEQKAPPIKKLSFHIPDFSEVDGTIERFHITNLDSLSNINAIDGSCAIELAPGLNVIYGDNGAGKSGVGRLLSNACFSRSPRKMLTNARSKSTAKQSARFVLNSTSGPNTIAYKFGDNVPALKTFSVFDREAALIHLNRDNRVEFVPQKVKVFDDVFQSVEFIEDALEELRNSKALDNPVEDLFQEESPVTELLDTLSHNTDLVKLQESLTFTPANKTTLAQKRKAVRALMKQDTSKQKAKLLEDCSDLERLKKELEKKSKVLSATRAQRVNATLKAIREKVEIAKGLSAKTFNVEHFKHIGSIEWKGLIQAAYKLYQAELKTSKKNELDHCLLCNQPLSKTETSLFQAYWKFLTSTAEQELATARQTLKGYLQTLESDAQNWPTFPAGDSAVKVLKNELPSDLATLKQQFKSINLDYRNWVEKIRNEADVEFTERTVDLSRIDALAQTKRVQEKALADPTKQIQKLEDEILVLAQKAQASALLPKIINYVKWLKWDAATRSVSLSAVRGGITRKKTELMSDLVVSRYVDTFNSECQLLNCDFGLKIESHGRDASTIKGLKLEYAKGQQPSDILSEGEQTVSALADFLTEAQIDDHNSGIIFDDPVTSLDHGRKSVIAQRLTTEADRRQVIILTHDIGFLLELEYFAQLNGVSSKSISLRRIGAQVGIVSPDLPWLTLSVQKRVGVLKNKLPELKKMESGDPDAYRNAVKIWFENLRESWERAVEERLFKGVIQRLNKAVQTQKLAKVDVTPGLIKEINVGMSTSSTWLHDMAVGTNPTVPSNDKLIKELQSLEAFLAKCKAD